MSAKTVGSALYLSLQVSTSSAAAGASGGKWKLAQSMVERCWGSLGLVVLAAWW